MSNEMHPCRFCGTAVMVLDRNADPEEYAARNCTCEESKKYRFSAEKAEAREEDINEAKKAVEDLIIGIEASETQSAAAEIIKSAISPIYDGYISGISVKSYAEAFKATKTASGRIKIERTERLSASTEV